jgi:hypothetical protein
MGVNQTSWEYRGIYNGVYTYIYIYITNKMIYGVWSSMLLPWESNV